jgi:DNA mismatch repair protein PMS2
MLVMRSSSKFNLQLWSPVRYTIIPFAVPYRFETFQKTTKIHQQPLLVPLIVPTTAAQESTIAEHMNIFEMNGFKLEIDETACHGKRVKLLCVPFSKTIQFGPEDVCELASILSEGYGESFLSGKDTKKYLVINNDSLIPALPVTNKSVDGALTPSRPNYYVLPKLMAMFASRACRSAVMIGTALNRKEMKNIIQQLENIDQPWNCPHGRPTMRHLVDLKSVM